MTPDPLSEAQARVDRVTYHLSELTTLLDDTAAACLDELEINRDPMTGEVAEVIEPETFSTSPPPLAAVLIGEVVYNLRAALDYLVYTLALSNTGTKVEGTQFPIEDTCEGFEARISGRLGRKRVSPFLKGVHADHVEMLRVLQPYKDCQWTRVLRDISNPDKHRHLTILLTESELDPYFKLVAPHPTEDYPVVGQIVIGANVGVKIMFEDSEGHDVLSALGTLQGAVSTTIQLFREDLETFNNRSAGILAP